MPAGGKDQAEVQENHDGTVTVKYQPKQSGQHEMAIKCNGAHIGGSPLQFVVDSVGHDSYVTAFGPGLSYGTAGAPSSFTVVAKEAAKGKSVIDSKSGLNVQAEGPAKVNVSCHDNKDGTITATWIPPTPGEYLLHVLYAGKDIQHSPFSARVAGEGRKRAHISVGSTSEVPLKVSEGDIKLLSASIKSPSGIEEPCLIRKIDDKTLGVSFTPREVGDHLVTVKKSGAIIPGAPFRIKVGQSDVGDASRVTCSGAGVTSAETQKFNQFTIDTSKAGYGGVSVSVEGPSRAVIECVENRDNRILMQWKPSEPGMYIVSVKFADHHVPGSPYTVKVTGHGVGMHTERLTHQLKQAPVVAAGQDVELQVRVPDTSAFDMCAKLLDPEGKSEDISLRAIDPDKGLYSITFTPAKEGINAIALTHRNQHVAGSPFPFTVGSFEADQGGYKVRAGGAGLVHGETGAENVFYAYTREAGPGQLSFAVEGPDKAKIKWNELTQGNGFVSYTVAKEGEYVVSIKFDDKHIPESPYRVQMASNTGEARKLEIASFPDMNMPVGKPVTFTVVTHHAKGKLDAKVTTPGNTTDDCFIAPIDDDETYSVRYVPKEAGMHFFSITLDGSHMHNSPFCLRVGGKDEADPLAVVVDGKGLHEGHTGQKLEYIINTCNSGAGILDIECSGPSKVTLDCYEVDVGYKVRYTPFAPGDYFMIVKYNNVHVPGSPFRIPIAGKAIGGSGENESSQVRVNTVVKTGEGIIVVPEYKGDASQVECKGMGLKKTFAGRMAQFTVECAKAGPDVLFVGVQSEKMGPASEVHVKHLGRLCYQVNYCVKDKGEFYIYVLYGKEHVPGSPFYIKA